MANKVTPNDIENMNELYLELKTYAAVARETGFSASTVRKYIMPNYTKKEDLLVKHLTVEELDRVERYVCSVEILTNESALILTEEEMIEMIEFAKELAI